MDGRCEAARRDDSGPGGPPWRHGGRGGVFARAVGLVTAAGMAACALLVGAGPARAQGAGQGMGATVRLGGLLRTGLLVGPSDLGQEDGFRIHDARLRATGKIGIVFNYRLQAAFDPERDQFDLLDAELTIPIKPGLAISLGEFKAPFGAEELQGKGKITFLERAQIDQLLAPGRQVGVQASGSFLDERLTYRAGMFNGNGRSFQNDDGRFLYAAHVQYNNVGPVEFYEDLMVQLGASFAFSRDSSVDLTNRGAFLGVPIALGSFRGDRTLVAVDFRSSYRGFLLRGEYMHGALDPAGAAASAGVEGGYVESGYSYLGAIEAVARFDGMTKGFLVVPGVGPTGVQPAGGNFLVFGLNLFPGSDTKLALQYALGLGNTELGPSSAFGPTGLADGQFGLTAQVDF